MGGIRGRLGTQSQPRCVCPSLVVRFVFLFFLFPNRGGFLSLFSRAHAHKRAACRRSPQRDWTLRCKGGGARCVWVLKQRRLFFRRPHTHTHTQNAPPPPCLHTAYTTRAPTFELAFCESCQSNLQYLCTPLPPLLVPFLCRRLCHWLFGWFCTYECQRFCVGCFCVCFSVSAGRAAARLFFWDLFLLRLFVFCFVLFAHEPQRSVSDSVSARRRLFRRRRTPFLLIANRPPPNRPPPFSPPKLAPAPAQPFPSCPLTT